MRYNINEPFLGDDCELEAKRIFAKNYLLSKNEVITSLKYQLEYIQAEDALTENTRTQKLELYERFLAAVKKCRLPDLSPDGWRYYQYEFVGDGIVLELCTIDEIEFHDDELDSARVSDLKELQKVNCNYVSIKEFASIQGVREETVVRWINAGKLKDAKLNGDEWLIPSVQNKPRRGSKFIDYIIEPNLHLDEFPFVQFSDNVYIQNTDDKAVYACYFSNYSTEFSEEMILPKEDVERLEFLLISSGKAKLSGHIQWMPIVK